MDDHDNPHFWIGVLTTAIGQVISRPDEADRILRPVGRDLATSDVLSRDLRKQLLRDLERKPRSHA